MKKIVSLILILSIFCSLNCLVLASEEEPVDEKAYAKLMLLEKIGIFNDYEEQDWDTGIKRDEFAHVLYMLTNSKNNLYIERDFSDVVSTNKYYNEIKYVSGNGYLCGVDENNFGVSREISLTDAATALIKVAGYNTHAISKGGYPDGYISEARSRKIFDGVGAEATRQNIYLMCYNALMISYLEPVGISGEYISHSNEKTLLEYFFDIYELKGTMTANEYTKTYDNVIPRKDTVEIDKRVYTCLEDYNDYIGMSVRGYYRYDEEDDQSEIVYIYAYEKDNNVIEIDAKDIGTLSNNCVLNYKVGEKNKQAKLLIGFDFIRNNRVDLSRANTDIYISDGSIKLIDSNDDGVYEIVIARVAETMMVTSVDYYENAVYCKEAVLRSSDNADSTFNIFLYENEQLTAIAIDQLEQGDVITAYRSDDAYFIEAIVCRDTIYGTVNGREDDKVIIDETEYELARNDIQNKLGLGLEVEIAVDSQNRLAYLISVIGGTSQFQYGYVFRVWHDDMEDAYFIKLITKNGIESIKCDNRLTIDGVSAQGSALNILGKELIRYRLSSKDMIKSVDTIRMSTYGDNDKLTLTNRGTLHYSPAAEIIDRKYKVDYETFKLVVPTVVSEKDDAELYSSYYEFGTDPSNYNFELYDVDNEDMSVGALLILPNESLLGEQTTAPNDSVGIVNKTGIRHIDGENEKVITLFISGEYKEFILDGTAANKSVDFGDVVRYRVNAKGRIASLDVELDVDRDQRGGVNKKYSVAGYYDFDFGKIKSKFSDYVIIIDGENNPGYTDSMEHRKVVSTENVQNCWLVDMTENMVTDVTSDYYSTFVAGENTPSYCYARSYRGNILNHMIIYKYGN